MVENQNNKYDAIIIGSGIGGMTSAALLSKVFAKKVLVLEKHTKLGGFTHAFSRKDYHWDVGVHYVGDITRNSLMGKIFDYITENRLKWTTIPEPYDTHVFPDMRIEIGQGYKAHADSLISHFPKEKENILAYLEDVKKVVAWQGRYNKSLILPPNLYWLANIIQKKDRDLALETTSDYLKRRFGDQKLRAALVSSWGNYGVLPKDSAFFIHCMNITHFFDGANYPVGGAQKISDEIKTTLHSLGSKTLTSRKVTEVIIKNNTAVGVKARYIKNPLKEDEAEEEIYYADLVISDAGAYHSYVTLLSNFGENAKVETFKKEIQEFPAGKAHVNLFIALKKSLATLGYKGGNLWISDKYDHDELEGDSKKVLDGIVQTSFMSSPSMRDPEATKDTAEMITFVDIDYFKNWADTQHYRRPEDYLALKEKMAQAMLNYGEKHLPGFKDLVEFYEISTPLTTVYYNNAPHGSMYGVAAIPARYKTDWARTYTPIKNYYLTGADVGAHSVMGALTGGFLTTGVSQGLLSFNKLFKEVERNPKNN